MRSLNQLGRCKQKDMVGDSRHRQTISPAHTFPEYPSEFSFRAYIPRESKGPKKPRLKFVHHSPISNG